MVITRVAAAAALSVSWLATAGASARPLMVYEAFDYVPGSSLAGLSGPFGWGGPWASGPFINAGASLTNVNALPSTGLRTNGSGPMEGFRPLFAPLFPTPVKDLWVSVLMRTPAGGVNTEFILQDFGSSSTVYLRRIPSAPIMLKVGSGPMVATPVPASAFGHTDLLVLRLHRVGATTVVDLYLNPAGPLVPTVSAPPVPGVVVISQVYMRIDSTQQLDEIRIGDAFGAVAAAGPCYPDCDLNGVLNINDFICFQTKYALSDPYTDCDGNGVLNISDFICFQTKFALGCP